MDWLLENWFSIVIFVLFIFMHIFGHGGWGGSLAFADLDARVSWAYVMNRMSPGTTGDSRAANLIAALYGAR